MASFFSMAGMSMVIPFLPFYIRELGVTDPAELEKWSGIVFSGPFILSFIVTPYWGKLGDKYGKKTMVIRALFGLSVSQLLVGLSANVYQVFLFRLIQGGISGFIAAALALVSSGSPNEKSGYAIGVYQSAISAGTIVGPLLGGFISDLFSYRTVFFITASLCFVSGILVIVNVKEPQHSKNNANYSVMNNLKLSINNKIIKTTLISICLIQISIGLSQPIFALFVESIADSHFYLSTITGSLLGITGVFSVISSPWWGKRNDAGHFRKNLLISIVSAGMILGMHSVIYNLYTIFPIRAILGFCIGGMIPVYYSIINKNIPYERKSGIMGITSSATLLGNLIGPLLCSLLSSFVRINFLFLISGLILLYNVSLIYKMTPKTLKNN